jgi:hypothetical protein
VFTGNLREVVVTEGVTGSLDFIYQVAVTGGPDSVGRMTTTDFAGFTTDVGSCSTCVDVINLNGPQTGTITPDEITRGILGNNVGFNFDIPSAHLAPGQETFLLVIKTNATTWGGGSTQLIDGGVATLDTFAPTPEPAFSAVLLGGLFGAGLFVTRRFRARQQS